MLDKVTAPALARMRSKGESIVCITAYDAILGALADRSGADIILVGDSVGNTALGYSSTIPVSQETMVHHTMAVRRGVSRALLVADLAFGTYQSSVQEAVANSVELVKAGAESVKLEGSYVAAIAEIVRAGIPVMGHVGMTPQSVNAFGGFRVQGKGAKSQTVIDEARRVQDAGAYAVVLELIPANLAREITESLEIPTIGIGAGAHCSGQVQVIYDVLGFGSSELKHAKRYLNGDEAVLSALKNYCCEVKSGSFPTEENSF